MNICSTRRSGSVLWALNTWTIHESSSNDTLLILVSDFFPFLSPIDTHLFLLLLHFCETEIYTYGFVFFYGGNKRASWDNVKAMHFIYHRVHCSILFDARRFDSSSPLYLNGTHDVLYTIIRVLL